MITPFVTVALLALILPGVALVIAGLHGSRRTRSDPVPRAQVRTGEDSPLRDRRAPTESVLSRLVKVGVGGGMIAAGMAVVHSAMHVLDGLDLTKGRLLRLRGKASLPAVARGAGWSDGTTPRVDHLSSRERIALAEAWLLAARMEHASIPAFAQLSLQLAALGAPSDLVEAAHRAALDELRHARRCYAMASAYAGEPLSAGAIPELTGASLSADIVRLAVGSLVDGCVNEGVAADVAAHGGRHAEDPVIRETLAMIAADEERHAELGWAVLSWCLDDPAARDAVTARVARLSTALSAPLPDAPAIPAARLTRHGLFDQIALGAIAERRVALVQARAAELLDSRARFADDAVHVRGGRG